MNGSSSINTYQKSSLIAKKELISQSATSYKQNSDLEGESAFGDSQAIKGIERLKL